MASKKYTLLAVLMMGFGLSTFAQLGGVLDYYDSSKVSSKHMARYNDWRSNPKTSVIPPKPRDQWQLGVYGGMFMIDGDGSAGTTGLNAFLPGWNVGLSLRKSLGYIVSVRGSIGYGETKGLDIQQNSNLANARVLDVYRIPGAPGAAPTAIGPGWYIHNYKTQMIKPSLDFVFSMGNLSMHHKQRKLNPYALVGWTPFIYQTRTDQLQEDPQGRGRPYNYASLPGSLFIRDRQDIKDELMDNFFDGNYESYTRDRRRRSNVDGGDGGDQGWQIRHGVNLGLGAEWRIGRNISLQGEVQYVMAFDDYVDGWMFANNNQADAGDIFNPKLTPENDGLVYANLGLNFNLGNRNKRVSPLWWYNPFQYAAWEARNPIIPIPVLADGDNDGVTDQFDIEPNTPAGCPVDTKGKSRDTDGDGVPDCRDKELITPTACQPVDADGVGKCPDPACCTVITPQPPGCTIGALPSVSFGGSSIAIGSTAQSVLDGAAAQIKANPNCKICVVGHGGASKKEQQASWDRVNSVINYLVEKQGISRDRFVFKYGEEGDKNTVDLQDCTGEDGPNMVPAPHPQLRKSK